MVWLWQIWTILTIDLKSFCKSRNLLSLSWPTLVLLKVKIVDYKSVNVSFLKSELFVFFVIWHDVGLFIFKTRTNTNDSGNNLEDFFNSIYTPTVNHIKSTHSACKTSIWYQAITLTKYTANGKHENEKINPIKIRTDVMFVNPSTTWIIKK